MLCPQEDEVLLKQGGLDEGLSGKWESSLQAVPLKQIDGSFHKHIFEARYNFSIECRQNRIQVVVQIFLAFSITHARFSFFFLNKNIGALKGERANCNRYITL